MQHELVNAARVAEAHFGLRRMHVDVDAAWIDLEEQQVTGLALAVQHLRIGFARGVRQHPVAHAAAVDEEVLRLGPRLRRSCVPEYTRRSSLRLDRQRGADEFAAQEPSYALLQGLTAQMAAGAAIVLERKRDLGARQRDAPEELVAVAELGGFAAQELAARRRKWQVVARAAGAVVLDLDALCAPLVERHGDAARVRVEAVLEQLLEHRRGPLDHLAGGDLADQEIGQDANRWHAKSI